MTNSVVIGLGVVGKATAHAFGITKYFDRKDILGYEKITLKEAAENRYIFICLPTPVGRNGKYETSTITQLVSQVTDYGRQNVFIIRSTVYPGYARWLMDKLRISWVVSNPEFLTEKTWKEDIEHPDIVVIGADHNVYLEDVEALYRSRYKGVDIFKTDTVTAELVKLAINGFYATKVVFANQICDYAQRAGANYEKIKEIMYKRKWIGKNHLDVFHQGGRGAGGKCLHKDFEALLVYSQLPLLKTIEGLNKSYLMESGK